MEQDYPRNNYSFALDELKFRPIMVVSLNFTQFSCVPLQVMCVILLMSNLTQLKSFLLLVKSHLDLI
jgi:hypothetical protein